MKLIKGLLVLVLTLCISLASCGSSTTERASDQRDNNSDLVDNSSNTGTTSDDGVQQLSDRSMASQNATSGSVFIFSPRKLRWYAYDADGKLLGSGRASGGRDFCPDIQEPCRTPVGTFQIDSMGDESCYSSIFPVGKGGTPMPYCMHVNADFSIHGSDEIPNYNASHGCIRVPPRVARWLRYNVLERGSTVIVQPY